MQSSLNVAEQVAKSLTEVMHELTVFFKGVALEKELSELKRSALSKVDSDVFHHMTGEVVRLQLAAYMFIMDRHRPAGWEERREKLVDVFNGLGNEA